MKTNLPVINGVKFCKHGLRVDGNYFPAFYSFGPLLVAPDYQTLRMAVRIYARGSCGRLPAALMPKNDSDMMTDYFESDRVTFWEGSPEFELLKAHFGR